MVDQKVFAQGRVNVWWVPSGGIANINAPTAAEINAGVALSEAIAWENYELAASESDDVDDRSILDLGNATTRGAAQFGGTLSFFRSLNPNDTTSPYVKAFDAFKVPRAYGYLVVRVLGNVAGQHTPVTAGQDVSVFYFVADTFVDDTEGDDSVKFTVNFQPQGQLAVYTKVAGGTLAQTPPTVSVQVGKAAKLTTRANTMDVSAGAKWVSSDTTKVSVSPAGVVKGIAVGTATVTSTFPGTTGAATTTVTVTV
jgi:hypothetical protein